MYILAIRTIASAAAMMRNLPVRRIRRILCAVMLNKYRNDPNYNLHYRVKMAMGLKMPIAPAA